MLRTSCFFVTLCIFSVGCQSKSFLGNGQNNTTQVQSVRVFVNDSDRGLTPQTIRIHRGRKELSVSLRQGRTAVRTFTVEEYYSQNAAEVQFSVSGTRPDGTLTYSVEDLPTKDRINYVIPYSEERLTIEDNQYGLTIIVID